MENLTDKRPKAPETLFAMPPAGPAGSKKLRPGDRVRLQPAGGGDIIDIALFGRTATVATVDEDLEGRLYLAVVLDDDPGQDLGRLGKPAHCFFFRPEELEPLGGQTPEAH